MIVPIFLIPIKWIVVILLLIAAAFAGYTIVNDNGYEPQESDYWTDSF